MAHLARLTTKQASQAYRSAEVAVLPIGSTEQHGPHLPVGTDHLIAEAIARDAAERNDVVMLPTLPIGMSRHHQHFHGTISTSSILLAEFLINILADVANHGLDRIVICNGHGGNIDALQRAIDSLRRDRIAYATRWTWTDAVDELNRELFGQGVGHAGGSESSLMLYLYEELVEEHEFETAEAGGPHSNTWGIENNGGYPSVDTIDFTSTGTTGFPTDASVEAGEQLFNLAAEKLNAHIDWMIELDEMWPANDLKTW